MQTASASPYLFDRDIRMLNAHVVAIEPTTGSVYEIGPRAEERLKR